MSIGRASARFVPACVFISLTAATATAQQFQEQSGILPMPTNYWTESVTPVDANEDGRWDVLFVHANGWAKPGDFHATGTFPLPPNLLVNTGTSGGDPVFVNESAKYLPAGLEIHGKGAAAADFNGDGHDDLVLVVAFGGIQRLLIRRPDTLAWEDESSRLPPLAINCWSSGVGDLDNDGDLDIVFVDAGRPPFAAPGGKARLCINDGSGHFAEQPDWISAENKIGPQNAKIVDIDNDFDLDVILDGKSLNTQIYFNDGNADFEFNDTLIPTADIYTYETEWADLDSDNDLDGIMMSLVFASEGAVQNFLDDTGALSFRATLESMTGLAPGEIEDDNEFVFLDSDDDGDLDVINVSLQSHQEKLYINSGVFGPGFLQFIPDTGFSKVIDASLDMGVADFDGDGDYDAITGQGEFNNFSPRYYRNTGKADTQPPRIGRIEDTPVTLSLASGGLVRRAWIQDSVWDDGLTFVTASLLFDFEKGGETGSGSVRMQHSGGQIFRGVVRPPPCSTGQVGTRVNYRIQAQDPNGNTSVSGAQSFVICGGESYGPEGSMRLRLDADPMLGAPLSMSVLGGAPGSSGLIAVGTSRADSLDGIVLVDRQSMQLFPLRFDDGGRASFSMPVPGDSTLAGFVLDVQAFAPDASQRAGLAVSNGLEIAVCAP